MSPLPASTQPPALPPSPPDAAPAAQALAPPHPALEVWRAFRRSRGALLGLGACVLLVLVALAAPWMGLHSPISQEQSSVLRPPVWLAGGSWSTPLGTDSVGRDLLARLIWGSRLSLAIGLLVVTVSLLLGVVLGLLAGFFGSWVDGVVMRLVDIMLALPSLLLAIAIVAVLGPSLQNAIVAISIVNIPYYIRLTRAAVLVELPKDYVTASRGAGAGALRMMFATLLPNCAAPLIVQATLGFSSAIIDAAALGFLGLGAQPPAPEWGTMLADALQFMQSAWWVVTFPGLTILLTVLAINLLGDGLRDALDPRLSI
jgi:dipeptide transport system permease protein